jgi:hypothetical protein
MTRAIDEPLFKLVRCVHHVAIHTLKWNPRRFARSVKEVLEKIPVDEEALVDVVGVDDVALVCDLLRYRPRADLLLALKEQDPKAVWTAPAQAPEPETEMTWDDAIEPETEMTWDELRALNRACFDRHEAATRRTEQRRGERKQRARPTPNRDAPVSDDRPLSAVLYDAAERGSLADVKSTGARLQRARNESQGNWAQEALLAGGVGPDGWTGLMRAALFGFAPVVKELLALGADSMKQNLYGQTALELAIVNGHRQCANMLVSKGHQLDHECLALHDFGAVRAALQKRWDELLDMEVIRALAEHDAVKRAELASELDRCEAQVEEANELLETCTGAENLEVVKLRRRIKELERQREPNAPTARMNKGLVSDLHLQINDLHTQVADLEEYGSALRSRLNNCEVNMEEQRERADSLARQNCTLMEWRSKRESAFQVEIEGSAKKMVNLEIEKARLTSEYRAAQVEALQQTEQVETLSKQVDEQQKKIEALTAELERKAEPLTVESTQTDESRSTASADRSAVFIGDVDDQAASESDDWFFADTPTIS